MVFRSEMSDVKSLLKYFFIYLLISNRNSEAITQIFKVHNFTLKLFGCQKRMMYYIDYRFICVINA